jgi:hypothetical protein
MEAPLQHRSQAGECCQRFFQIFQISTLHRQLHQPSSYERIINLYQSILIDKTSWGLNWNIITVANFIFVIPKCCLMTALLEAETCSWLFEQYTVVFDRSTLVFRCHCIANGMNHLKGKYRILTILYQNKAGQYNWVIQYSKQSWLITNKRAVYVSSGDQIQWTIKYHHHASVES